MTNGCIRAVIFDFGGVFTTSPIENFAAYEAARGLPERFIGDVIKAKLHTSAFARFERAEISFDEFDRLFALETRAAGHEISGRDFVRLLDVAPKPEMITALSRVKAARLLTGCITNNFEGFGPGRSAGRDADSGALHAIFDAFDHVIESSKAGVRKPEPRIYEMMVEALGVAAAECVFLDDLGVNLKPALALGMRTIKVPFGDVRPAIAELGAVTGLSLL